MWTLRRDIWHDLEAQKRQKHGLKNFINDQRSHATSWAALMQTRTHIYRPLAGV